jgi:hypothetical protein
VLLIGSFFERIFISGWHCLFEGKCYLNAIE